MNGTTRKDRMLAILADRQWHPTDELKAEDCGGHRYSTVIDELRKAGYEIDSEPVSARKWRYRLVWTPDERPEVVTISRAGQTLLGFDTGEAA